ncbi:MAG TPA: hypothetical protein PKH92_08025 [Anaerolineaceae bacterium]|nr:hypothetical protein [Anaerolineaceae bacterium]HNS36949.1 hypothetical protein [Anaerolineaceae bacterium]HOD04974.1 hypothetical protein [Anaerolineaceae bacterium]
MAGGRKKSGLLVVLLGLIVIVVLGGAYYYFAVLKPQANGGVMGPNGEVEPTAPPPTDLVDIFITLQDVKRGEILTEANLGTIQYPRAELEASGGIFIVADSEDIKKEELLGLTAVYDLKARMPLTMEMLVDAGGNAWSPSFDVPVGMTALAISINDLTAVAYALQPGDHVMVTGCMWVQDYDLEFQTPLPNAAGFLAETTSVYEDEGRAILPVTAVVNSGTEESVLGNEFNITADDGTTYRYQPIGRVEDLQGFKFYIQPSETQRERLVCQNIIQDAIVLKIGSYFDDAAAQAAAAETNAEGGEETAPPPAIAPALATLMMPPQDALRLNYMMLAGIRITLSMRNPTDSTIYLTDAVTQQYLMDQSVIPLPAKLPYGVAPINEVEPFPYPEQP